MRNRLKILYEDKHLLVVDKPSKLLTVATEKEKNKTLYHQVFAYLKAKNQKVFIVHRLDRDTSGLVLFAKSEKVKQMIQDRWQEVIRKYIAVVYGKVNNKGEIHNYLSESKTLITYISNKEKGKEAITRYNLVDYNEKLNISLVDIEILTGRKNQIRVHMNSIKHPILGDMKYGDKKLKQNRMYLHAYYLSFYHPIRKENIIVKTYIPKEFIRFFINKKTS